MNPSLRVLFIARSTLFSQPGGDTIQVEETAYFLQRLGHEVDIKLRGHGIDVEQYDIVHFFNLFRPADILPYLRKIKKLVVTAIYVDYTEYDSQHRDLLFKMAHKLFGKFGPEYLKTLARFYRNNERTGLYYFLNGQEKAIAKVLAHASHIITSSEQEWQAICSDFPQAGDIDHSCVRLGSEHFTVSKKPATEREGIICAARVEGIKNQLNLIRAIKKLPQLKLKLFGKPAANQKDYFQKCMAEAGEQVEYEGQANKQQLADAFASARVHAMPSFYETTGLSTLEALKSGCQVVISNRGGQKEIFENVAFFCEPTDPASIASAIEKAYAAKGNHQDWVKRNFSWKLAAEKTAYIYTKLLQTK